MRRVFVVIPIIILLVLIFSSYCNTFRSPPILDDYHSFIDEQSVYTKQLSIESLLTLSKSVFGWARWIPMLSFLIDRSIGNGSIVPFHVTNTVLHAFCLLAVLFLVFNLLKASGEIDPSVTGISSSLIAISVAGLWALHPVQTNAVTYLVQRMASIQALFFVTSTAFYVLGRRKHLQCGSLIQAFPFYVACLIASLGAFLSKENSLMLPVMVLVTEMWFFSPDLHLSVWKRFLKSRKLVRAVLLILLLCLAFLSVKMWGNLTAGYAGRHFTLGERLLTEMRIVVWYVTLLLWPAPSRMSIEHDVVISTSLINPPFTLLAFASLILLGWLTIHYRKKYPLITYGLVWFFLNLLIESSVVPLELIFEHRLYLPSVGFSLTFTCVVVSAFRYVLARKTARDFEIITCCVFALLVSALSLLTFSRNEAWRNSIAIHMDAVLKAPNHPRAHANLAVALAKAGFYEPAISKAEAAIGLGQERYEQYLVAANAIVASLNGLGKHVEAAERGEQMLEDVPKRPNAIAVPALHLNIAEAYLKLGRLDKAYVSTMKSLVLAQRLGRDRVDLILIQEMLSLILQEAAITQVDLDQDGAYDPGVLPVKTWLAKAFLEQGERGEATKLLMQASMENPEDRATVLLLEGIKREDELNSAQAAKDKMKENYLSSPFSRFNAAMALAYKLRREDLPSGLRKFGEKSLDYALELQPTVADAQLLKAWYLRDRNETEPAIASARRALAVDPDYAKAWAGLGFFLMEANQLEEAVSAFNKTLELYPGSPQRKTIMEIIAGIQENIPHPANQGNEQ
jgi:protein O-mannosyl-transferase